MKFLKLGLASLVASSTLFAGTYSVDASHSNVGFSIKHMMITNVTGKFNDVSGNFEYDEKTNTLKALSEMIASAGLKHPAEIKARHLAQRINDREIRNYAQLHFWLKDGELLSCENKDEENFYFRMWNMSKLEHF